MGLERGTAKGNSEFTLSFTPCFNMRCWCGRLWFLKWDIVCALKRGDWGAEEEYLWIVGCCFLKVFVLCLCPFFKQNHPMHSLYCKGSLFMDAFCKLSLPSSMPHTKTQWTFIETVFPSTHWKKDGNFHSRPPLLRPITPFTAHFLEVPSELLSGSWNNSVPLRHLLHIFAYCAVFHYSEVLVW